MSYAPAIIRPAKEDDLDALLPLYGALWTDEPPEEVRPHVASILAGTPRSTLPLTTFVAEHEESLVGFVEVGLRSHAEGCDPTRAVGFIEGWYVTPNFRKRGVGRALVARAEAWSRQNGAAELGSDTWIDHQMSIDAHQALGFEVAERAIHFRKDL